MLWGRRRPTLAVCKEIAYPEPSTAMQKVEVVHETELIERVESTLLGLDHEDPL